MRTSGFFALAQEEPGRLALIDPSGAHITAGDLLAGMRRTEGALAGLGLRAGDTVAVLLANRREFLEAYGAAIESGLLFVAVNWHLRPAEISYILRDSSAKALITEARFAAAGSDAASEAGIDPSARLTVDAAEGLHAFPGPTDGAPPEPHLSAAAGQIMFYTSGTTGRPKGVRKRFRAAASDELTLTSGIGPVRWAAAKAPEAPADLVYLSSGPFYHALPIAGAAGALDRGGVLVVMDKWTPEEFLELVARHRVTDATLVPTMFHRLLALPEETRAQSDVSSLRAVNHAGAPCPVEVKRRMIEWWGPIITESYSSTEGAGTSVTSQEWLERPGTVGRPSPGVQIKIFDQEGNECPAGTPGLIYLTPALWDFEYHHDEDKTRSASRDGMFTVGDIGYLDQDGYLFLCGRQSDTIISGGVNIYPAEVEAVILQHPAVRDVAVIGVPNEEWGEEVRAVVETTGGAAPGPALESELVEFCRERIATFKCPRAVDFVGSLERDPNGKLRKAAIRERYWARHARRI